MISKHLNYGDIMISVYNILAEVTLNETQVSNRKTLSISTKTYARLRRLGIWSESADELLNRILDEREGRERTGGSF